MKLNRRPKLNRRVPPRKMEWWEKFPHFPIRYFAVEEDGVEKRKTSIRCHKDGIERGVSIDLDVCLHSILRFDPNSKNCRRCFGLSKGQHFPSEALEIKKRSFYSEAEAFVSNRMLKMRGDNGNENKPSDLEAAAEGRPDL